MRRIIYPVFMLLACGCSLDHPDNDGLYVFSDLSDFSKSEAGWSVDFAQYPATKEDSMNYGLEFSYTTLPEELNSNQKAIKISGYDLGTNLFMYMTKKVTGLQPDTDYTLVFEVEFASNAPTGAFGTGGAPGESVYMKGGASAYQPKKVIDGSNFVLNIDKGDYLDGGESMTVLGHIGVAPNTKQFTLINRSNTNSNTLFSARTNSKGELWLIVGTDSNYTGATTIYYTRINVVFSTYH